MTNSLGFTLHYLSSILDRQSDMVLENQLGIGYSQFKILMALRHRAGVQQNEIARYLAQTEASISRQIKLMQSQGLLEARVDPANRRKRETVLTEKGRDLAQNAVEVLESTHAKVFGGLSYNEEKMMRKLLDRMIENASVTEKPVN